MIGFVQTALIYIVPFLIVLGVVVTVHELGHFLAARWLGTKIDQFSIGFGRPIAQWRDRQGVQWRVGWLPLGGFVRFAGDDNAASVPDNDDLEALRRDLVTREGEGALGQYFHFKPIWQRAVITAAGPFANFLLAIVVFAGLLMVMGEPSQSARIARVEANTPAARAGLMPGDVILAGEGRPIKTPDAVKQLIVLRSGVPTDFTVDRGGRILDVVVTPERGDVVDGLGRVQRLGRIGIAFADSPVRFERVGPVGALLGGVERTGDVITTTVFYIGRMLSGRETADQLSGPLGMAQISGELTKQNVEVAPDMNAFVRNGVLTILVLVANISVGIGFLNLLPIPVLDGGHLLFYAYEALARRPLAAKVQAAGYRVGLALVLGLMLFATWNDLQRLRVFNLFGGLFS
ncbi:RIP metalloprotease [Phenylobacterium sp. J367]|uniref:M50 family metallopeptidase n=1 Tax=Phenylobacterium sp. J367 TaxID=2898435 RepID=UPI002150F196|nr:M50 family metallopeptidase [Phenylobacterium sp. J367]MCR5880464.1 RIP metalloprotease [Phenylobacterium sp. J367]